MKTSRRVTWFSKVRIARRSPQRCRNCAHLSHLGVHGVLLLPVRRPSLNNSHLRQESSLFWPLISHSCLPQFHLPPPSRARQLVSSSVNSMTVFSIRTASSSKKLRDHVDLVLHHLHFVIETRRLLHPPNNIVQYCTHLRNQDCLLYVPKFYLTQYYFEAAM